MEKSIRPDSLKLNYDKYKNTNMVTIGISVVLFVITFLLITQVIIPQVQSWLQAQEQIKQIRGRITTMKTNLSFIQSMDNNKLDTDSQAAVAALPDDKDFSGILNAISVASVKSGIGLDDFSFTIGEVGKNKKKSPNPDDQYNTKVTLDIKGDLDAIKTFISEIESKIPMSKVLIVDDTADSAKADIQFYSKPIPDTKVDKDSDAQPIQQLSAADNTLLEKIHQWNLDSTSLDSVINAGSSSSASITQDPF